MPIWRPSPNFGLRRGDARPELIVIHHTAMKSCDAALERLCDPASEVSAHFLISEKGEVFQMVEEHARAWHAGQGSWKGITDVNSHSIGIELDNYGNTAFSESLLVALENLLQELLKRHNIVPDGVIGHSDMAPGRKFDPGPHFDWKRLEQKGLAGKRGTLRLDAEPNMATFRELARSAGYTADVDDETLLEAVRLRFRPSATGPLAADDYTPLMPTT